MPIHHRYMRAKGLPTSTNCTHRLPTPNNTPLVHALSPRLVGELALTMPRAQGTCQADGSCYELVPSAHPHGSCSIFMLARLCSFSCAYSVGPSFSGFFIASRQHMLAPTSIVLHPLTVYQVPGRFSFLASHRGLSRL